MKTVKFKFLKNLYEHGTQSMENNFYKWYAELQEDLY